MSAVAVPYRPEGVVCRHCGAAIPPIIGETYGAWVERYFCDRRICQRIEGRLDDVSWLLEQGESPAQVAARLAFSPRSLARWLWRHGERQLASRFEQVAS